MNNKQYKGKNNNQQKQINNCTLMASRNKRVHIQMYTNKCTDRIQTFKATSDNLCNLFVISMLSHCQHA